MKEAGLTGKALDDGVDLHFEAYEASLFKERGASSYGGQLSAGLIPLLGGGADNPLGLPDAPLPGIGDVPFGPQIGPIDSGSPPGVPIGGASVPALSSASATGAGSLGSTGVLGALGQINPFSQAPGFSSALSQALSGSPVGEINLGADVTQQFFEKSIQAPLLRAFDQEIAPRINEAFAGAGASLSSRRGDATTRALEGLQTTFASELARATLANQQLEANLNARLMETGARTQAGSLGTALASQNQPLQQTLAATGALLPFQGLAQAELNRRFGEFQRNVPENDPYVKLGLNFAGQQQTVVNAGQGGSGGAIGGIGGAGLGALLGAGLGPLGILGGAAIGGNLGGDIGSSFG